MRDWDDAYANSAHIPGADKLPALWAERAAAYRAGLKAGVCPDLDGFAATWRLDRRFEPQMDEATRERKWSGWQDAVRRTLTRR